MDVKGVAVQVVGQASNLVVPFSGPALEALLGAVLDVQDEQLTRLRGIEEHVQRLADGPWESGHVRVEEAALPQQTPERIRDLLSRAADNFRDAIPLQPDASFSRAQVCLDLAIVLALLGDQTAMRHYAQTAYVTARRSMWITTQECARASRGRAISRRHRAHLAAVSAWFEDFDYAAAALGDPEADVVHTQSLAVEDDVEVVRWRPDALLDFRYLTRQRDPSYRDVRRALRMYDRLARPPGGYDSEPSAADEPRPGDPWTHDLWADEPLAFDDLDDRTAWREFWRQPESVVTTPPERPALRPYRELEVELLRRRGRR